MPRLLVLAIATAGGVGLAPVAPGTAGSALALPLFLGLGALPLPLYLLTLAALISLGVWASDLAEGIFQRHDDGRIVIDEVAGQLIALSPLLLLSLEASLPWLVTGFVAFRVFDIWKPGPVRMAERRFSGGLGVMLDDVVAGLLAALTLGLAGLGMRYAP